MRPVTVLKLQLPLLLSNCKPITQEVLDDFIEKEVAARCSSFTVGYFDGYENGKSTKFAEITIYAVGLNDQKYKQVMERIGHVFATQFLLKTPHFTSYHGSFSLT